MANFMTIVLSGIEEKVTFSGSNAWLRNDSVSAIYAAKTAGIMPGTDGVVLIPAGSSAPVYGANGTIFLIGTGSVQLIGSDYGTNPFKTVSAGGSGADDVARAAISSHEKNTDIHVTAEEKAYWNSKADLADIPASLPANGGNADTVGGYNAAYFFKWIGNKNTSNSCNECTETGFYFFNGCKEDAPTPSGSLSSGTYFILENLSYNGSYFRQTATFVHGAADYLGRTFTRYCNNGEWSEWVRINGDADTLDGLHATDFITNIVSDTAGMVSLYGLQGGIPFSSITLSGDIVGQEITLTVNGTEYSITPDSNPYNVPNDIRQQDDVNTVSVSSGNVTVASAKRNAALKRAWDKIDELASSIGLNANT